MSSPHKVLDFRGGGWVLLLSGLFCLAATIYFLMPVLRSGGLHARGDGEDVSTYRFDLSALLVPREGLASTGLPVDGLPTLDHPPTLTVRQVDAINAEIRGKYLVGSDRVIGVAIAGEARAYPLRVMNWHEIANDTLAGVPIAVTFHPLSESVAVFDRRVEGRTHEFGFSGLVYQSTLLMYGRDAPEGAESLWLPLQGRAVSGPEALAGRRLRLLPCSLTTWEAWRRRYPQTTVPKPGPRFIERYQREPFSTYNQTEELKFPVTKLGLTESWPLKARLLIVDPWGSRQVVPLTAAARKASDPDPDPSLIEAIEWTQEPAGVLAVDARDDSPGSIFAFAFAWEATN